MVNAGFPERDALPENAPQNYGNRSATNRIWVNLQRSSGRDAPDDKCGPATALPTQLTHTSKNTVSSSPWSRRSNTNPCSSRVATSVDRRSSGTDDRSVSEASELMAFSERFFFHRTDKIIAIGVDDPSLARELIDHAFALLDSCDWVIGPAADGGYYLIGCRAAAFNPEVFIDIEWGTNSVLSATLEKIRGWTSCVAQLPERRDIDAGEDLALYRSEGGVGTLLREWGYD